MHPKEDNFTSLVKFFRMLDDVQWNEGTITGRLHISKEVIPFILKLENDGLIDPSYKFHGKEERINRSALESKIGESAIFQFDQIRESHNHIFFAPTLDDMLTGKLAFERPSLFFIADENFYSLEDIPNEKISKYYATLKLVELLREQCDFIELTSVEKLTLHFFQDGKTAIPINYTGEDITLLPGLESLTEILSTPEHKQQKRNLFASALASTLQSIASDTRFCHLLMNFESVADTFYQSFKLYMSEFSIGKLREELRAKKTEYTAKINNIICDIQGRLLAIPVALILVGGQMKDGAGHLLTNSIILGGVLVFALFMFLLLHNQSSTLKQLKSELTEQKRKLADEYADISFHFDDTFTFLNKRTCFQTWSIRAIGTIVWIGVFIALILFGYCTPEIKQAFLNFMAQP